MRTVFHASRFLRRGFRFAHSGLAAIGVAFLSATVGAPSAAADSPLGFQVLGTVPPAYVDTIPIPGGFSEQAPDTNFTLPSLTPEETNRGYLSFARNYLDPVYPGTRPLRTEITGRVEMFSALGEYEAGSFAIHALGDLQDVQVTLGDLTGPGGSTLSASNLDLRTVRCMPRRVWAQPRYVGSPTLLEKRPLIDIPQDTTQQFWLTAYVPPDTPAGQYTGQIQIHPGSGAPASSLQFDLEVLPLELATPPTVHGMYYNPTYMTSWPDPLPAQRLLNDVMNMKEHGMNTLFVTYPTVTHAQWTDEKLRFDLSPMQPFGDACELAGFDSIVYNVILSELIANPLGTWGTMLRAYAASFEEQGWPDLIASVGDEADVSPERQELAMSRLLYLRNHVPEIERYQNIVYPRNSEVFEPWADIRAFSSYADETVVEPTRAAGRELWMYSGAAEYGLNPEGDRLYRGLWAAKLGLDGALAWTYYHPVVDPAQPYQDLFPASIRNNMTLWVFPGEDGPLPSPGWEGMREGIEDEKYAYNLQILAELSQMSPAFSSSFIVLGQKAGQYLQQVYDQIDTSPRPNDSVFPIRQATGQLDSNFYNDFRRQAGAYILQLSAEPAWTQAHGGLRAHISYDSTLSPDIAADADFDLQLQVGSGVHAVVPGAGRPGADGALFALGQKASYYDTDAGGGGMLRTLNGREGTVEMWVAPHYDGSAGIGPPDSAQALFISGDGLWDTGLQIFLYNNGYPDDEGQLFAHWNDGTDGVILNNSLLEPSGGDLLGTIADWRADQWHHIVFCWDETTLGLYLDGGIVMEVARPTADAIDYLTGGIWVGGYSADGVNAVYSWEGRIDDLKIWDQAMPPTALPGDLNGDGFVGQGDLDLLLAEWGHNPPMNARADPTHDGLVGQADLDVVLADWGAGTLPPGSAIPEPATLSLLVPGGLMVVRRKRRS